MAVQNENEIKIESFNSQFEQLDEQYKDVQKHLIEFEREFSKTGKSKGNADKLVRFSQDRVTSSEAMIGKLKLKRQSMKDQLRKTNLSLKQKEESGDTLLAVDFQQLRIENTQYLEKIEEKNKELIRSKQKSGKVQSLTQSKRQELQNELTRQEELKLKIDIVKRELNSMTDDERTLEEVTEVKNELNEKRSNIKSYTVPEVFEYIKQAGESAELEHGIKEWSRKVQIAEGANKSVRSQLRNILKT